MAFCEFSSEVISKNSVAIDNLFITDFLPNAEDKCIKVYLYGLFLCNNSKDNTIETFEKNLNMKREDILSVFYYWQEKGLVQVINIEPVIIKYLPTKNAIQKLKKYNVDKYTGFNISAQELIGSKMLTPRELEEFYYLIETLGQEKEAVLKIIDFCVKQKGKNVSVNYIVKVAKDWAYDGVKSAEDVDFRILDQERISGDITELLKAMGFRRQATNDEFGFFLDWTKNLEFATSILVLIAKKSKVKSFNTLNDLVQNCYKLKLTSEKEIADYFDARDRMLTLSRTVVKNLGLYYQDLSVIVDSYISKWLQLGFEEEAIIKLSNLAFKSSIRSLDGLNMQMEQMFKIGILTNDAIDNYMENIVKDDNKIAEILSALGIVRNVNSQDRLFYKTWIFDWNMSEELISYAVTLAVNKYMPMQYLNKVLAEYHVAQVKTIDDAKKLVVVPDAKNAKIDTSKRAEKREYSKQELDSLFDNIYEVEI